MVTTKLNLSMTEPQVRQIYAKQGDTGRVLDISLDQTPEDGTLRILRPDGTEVTSEAVTGGEVESGSSFESLTEADVTELSVGIEPVQDLNGYDAPWVGGAGKNLLNITTTTQTVSGVTFTVNSDGTIKANGTATARIALALATNASETPILNKSVIMNGCPSGGSTNTYFIQWYGYDGASAVANDTGNGTSAFTPTSTAGVIAIVIQSGVAVNNLIFKPMIRLATETDSTFAPYSNICPITGHDSVSVYSTGKNLNPWQGVNYSASVSRTIWLNEGTYILSTDNGNYLGGNNAIYFAHYDANGNNITEGAISSTQLTLNGGKTFYYGSLRSSYVFTILKEGLYSFGFNNEVPSNVGALQLELGSTATAYEPYQGSTYTTSLGQTVYGGTLDLVSGVLTVDKAMVTLNGSETWNVNSATSGLYYTTITDLKASGSAVSNAFEQTTVAGANMVNGQFKLVAPNLVNFKTEHATVTDWKTWLSSTNVQLCYELATSQTYALTPQQIKTLVGTNNVWASSGDIVSIKFAYDGLLSELPSEATEIVGKCYCDIEQNGVSSMPFTLNVKKNERQ